MDLKQAVQPDAINRSFLMIKKTSDILISAFIGSTLICGMLLSFVTTLTWAEKEGYVVWVETEVDNQCVSFYCNELVNQPMTVAKKEEL